MRYTSLVGRNCPICCSPLPRKRPYSDVSSTVSSRVSQGAHRSERSSLLPNLALWDQGAPPSAARTGPVTLAPAPHPSRHAGLPLRSARRPCGAAGVHPRQRAADGDGQGVPSAEAPGRSRDPRPDRAGHGDRRPSTLRADGHWTCQSRPTETSAGQDSCQDGNRFEV